MKGLFDTAGVRTTGGARFWEDRVPDSDATVVRRLHEAGAIVLAKLATHELAYGVTTQNPHFGPTPNPWNRSRIPGGSSRTYPPPREVGITHGATQTGTVPTGIQRLEAVQVLRSTQGVCPVRDDLRLAD